MGPAGGTLTPPHFELRATHADLGRAGGVSRLKTGVMKMMEVAAGTTSPRGGGADTKARPLLRMPGALPRGRVPTAKARELLAGGETVSSNTEASGCQRLPGWRRFGAGWPTGSPRARLDAARTSVRIATKMRGVAQLAGEPFRLGPEAAAELSAVLRKLQFEGMIECLGANSLAAQGAGPLSCAASGPLHRRSLGASTGDFGATVTGATTRGAAAPRGGMHGLLVLFILAQTSANRRRRTVLRCCGA